MYSLGTMNTGHRFNHSAISNKRELADTVCTLMNLLSINTDGTEDNNSQNRCTGAF